MLRQSAALLLLPVQFLTLLGFLVSCQIMPNSLLVLLENKRSF